MHEQYEYFKTSEFDSPDLPGSGENMQVEFMLALDDARRIAGIPFKVTSGYRTPQRNLDVGGVRNSAHTRGWAADIAAPTLVQAMRIITAGWEAGIRRFGIYPKRGFIHMDMDPRKPAPVFWEG